MSESFTGSRIVVAHKRSTRPYAVAVAAVGWVGKSRWEACQFVFGRVSFLGYPVPPSNEFVSELQAIVFALHATDDARMLTIASSAIDVVRNVRRPSGSRWRGCFSCEVRDMLRRRGARLGHATSADGLSLARARQLAESALAKDLFPFGGGEAP